MFVAVFFFVNAIAVLFTINHGLQTSDVGDAFVKIEVDSIEVVGPIEADDPDRTIGLDDECFGHVVHHD